MFAYPIRYRNAALSRLLKWSLNVPSSLATLATNPPDLDFIAAFE